MSYFTERFLNFIIERYRIKSVPDVFIETGTYKGISISNIAMRFRSIHTIELSPTLYKNALEKFRNDNHIMCHCGDSAAALENLLPANNEPILFWLDAHYSKGESIRGPEEIPLLRELEAIRKAKRKYRDIIVMDDTPTMGKKGVLINKEDPNYPELTEYDWSDVTFKKILDIIHKMPGHHYHEFVWGTLIVLTNLNMQDFCRIYSKRLLRYLTAKKNILIETLRNALSKTKHFFLRYFS